MAKFAGYGSKDEYARIHKYTCDAQKSLNALQYNIERE